MNRDAPPRDTDVLIVGAGPTGLALGCRLAQKGVRHLLVDQAEEGANTSRASVIHARTLELLARIGVTERLLREGVVVSHFSVRDRDERLLELDFSGLPTRYPFTLMLPQSVTEAILLERLSSLGAEVHRPLRAGALVEDDQGVTATLLDARPDTMADDARHLVRA